MTLNVDDFNSLMSFSYKVAKAINKNVKCKRVAISVIGLEVPHVHVHLIPISNMDDVRFIKKVKIFLSYFLDDRARTLDLICLIIFLGIIFDINLFTKIILYLFLIKKTLVFFGNFLEIIILEKLKNKI